MLISIGESKRDGSETGSRHRHAEVVVAVSGVLDIAALNDELTVAAVATAVATAANVWNEVVVVVVVVGLIVVICVSCIMIIGTIIIIIIISTTSSGTIIIIIHVILIDLYSGMAHHTL